MKVLLLALLALSSNLAFAGTVTCYNKMEGYLVTLESRNLTVNGKSNECQEQAGDVCTAINFETIEVTRLTLSKENQNGILEVMPAPGSGEIKTIEVKCFFKDEL